ncbi:MAG: CGNR zinc finger domain-containing protein [Candidatus Limnocylindria bacterium]
MTDLHDALPEPTPEPELFIEFANRLRLSPDTEPAPDADRAVLRGWLGERGLLKGRTSDARLSGELPRFRELRGLVRAIGDRVAAGKEPTRSQIAAVNGVMRDGLHYHALRAANGGDRRFRMEPVGDELDQARSAVAGSLAHYLAEHDERRLKVCADDTCRWLFVDQSPAGRRRWCDMRTCGNRNKVARHRARARRAARS